MSRHPQALALALVFIVTPGLVAQDRVPARVRAAREIDVPAEVAGRVVGRPVPRNARVEAGTVVLSVDPTFYRLAAARMRAALAKAQADQRLADAELLRVEKLTPSGSIEAAAADRVRATRDAAIAVREGAEAALAEAEERLRRTEIRAPASGLVTEIHPEIGESVAAGTPVVRILTVDELVAECFVTAEQALRVARGDVLPVALPTPWNRTIEGKVREIAGGAGRERSFRVVLDLAERPAKLLAGFDAVVIVPR